MIPDVTVCCSPSGLPIAITVSPIIKSSLRPSRRCASGFDASTFSTARSWSVSTATIRAGNVCLSANVTCASEACETTCALVTMYPLSCTTSPDPTLCTRWAP